MDISNPSDCEMDCDFINRPRAIENLGECNVQEIHNECITERPSTPPNNVSNVSLDLCMTPLSNMDCDNEPSFIRRIGLDKLNRHKYTSTPIYFRNLQNRPKTPNSDPPSQCPNSVNSKQRQQLDSPNTFGPDKIPLEYINPFSPDGKVLSLSMKANTQKGSKRLNTSSLKKLELSDGFLSDENLCIDFDVDLPLRSRLSEFNVARFNEEFVRLKKIGQGVHGLVYKCLNRLNGCIYAVKKTIRPIQCGSHERKVRNEIYAHGVLDHLNIVRNFSCWKEEGYVFIQNEYCNGGNLEEYIKSNVMSETLLRNLILQMAHALSYMNKKGLAHMDIKTENIFVCIESKENSIESDGGYSDDDKTEDIVFKLGDLGHITKLDEENDVDEGDCRYIAREILEESFKYLDRSDMFSLGLTVYEASGGGPLPKNGEEWQQLRNGHLKPLKQHTKNFNNILKAMTHPSPERRPTPAELIQMVQPNRTSSSPEDFSGYIRQYQRNNSVLEHKVEATGQYLRVLFNSHKHLQEQLIGGKDRSGSPGKEKIGVGRKRGGVSKNRVVGKKSTRSSSTTTF